jgi:tRNA U34 5-carboxymethylaminomethyl modifying enzyme MnmG/GidA
MYGNLQTSQWFSCQVIVRSGARAAGTEAALAFARENGLTMMFTGSKVEFGRADTKRDDDA